MGRNTKHTLFYSPLYCDFWDRHEVLCIEEDEGITGSHVALRIRSMIYQDCGYYMEWPDRFEYTIAKRIGNGITGADVLRIFNVCLKHGFFDQKIFNAHRVVTSADIQQTWLEVMKILRRLITVSASVWLISSEGIGITSEEIAESVAESTQKEERKELSNEKSGAELHSATPSPISDNSISSEEKTDQPAATDKPKRKRNAGAEKIFVEPTIAEVNAWFLSKYYSKAPNGWFPDRFKIEAADFWDYYHGNGWKQGKVKLVSWESAASRWLRKARLGVYSDPVGNNAPTGSGAAASIPYNQSREKRSKQLPQIEQDINFSFARYREDPTKLTIEMVEATYFDHFQSRGIIISDAAIIAEIKAESAKYITDKQLPDSMLAQVQRKIAVIKIFQLWKTNDREEIFLTD